MQKVLRKRVLRDLKKNFFRYFALGLVIAMGIFLVVTIVGSGETLSRGTEDIAEKTNLEDGEFEVFVPLSSSDKDHIADMGIDIEEHFFFDYQRDDEDKSTVRIFKVRESIDKIYYIEGKEPEDDNDIVLEKRYAEEHGINVGDSFDLAGKNYTVSGIGVVSDYDGPFKEISDTSCNSITFGPVFISEEAYEEFKASGKTQKSEDYLYAYKLGEGKTNADLKDFLKDIKIDSSEVDDELFQEYWDRTGGVPDELRDAVKELRDATEDVRDGLDELSDGSDDILTATDELFDAYLVQTENALKGYGMDIDLTETNFESKLDDLIEASPNEVMKSTLRDTKKQLADLKDYKDGISDYTDGVGELYDGMDDMADGVKDMAESVEDALKDSDYELSNLTMFLKQEDNPRIYATKNDKVVDIDVGIIAGVIVFILLAYVISVFVVHSIESESSIIGTLYSMGVTKNDLLMHYITLPVVVTFIAGLVGAVIASTGVLAPMIAESSYAYFSIPVFTFHVPMYL